jgi:hypothetical protein
MPAKNSLAKVQRNRSANTQPVLQSGKPAAKKPERIKKTFYIEKTRAARWDLLVAHMKNAPNKKSSTELLDEAFDGIFEKYSGQIGVI